MDSLLLIEANTAADTSSVRINLALALEQQKTSFDSALVFYQEALSLAERIREEYPYLEPEVLSQMGRSYRSVRQKERAVELLKKSMVIARERGLQKQLSFTQFDLGYTYQGMSDFEMAILHYDSVIVRNVQEGTNHQLARAYNYSGLCSYYLRKLDRASERILEAIRYRKATGDTARIHYPYMVYGLILKEQKQYEEGKGYIRESRRIAQFNGAMRRVALAYTNIGQILILQDSLDAAFRSLTNAWKINRELGYKWGTVSYYQNVSWIREKQGRYQEAYDFTKDAIASLYDGAAIKSRADVYGSHCEMALLLADSVHQNNPVVASTLLANALPYAKEGWVLAAEANSGNVKLRMALVLSRLYARTGNHPKALDFSQKAFAVSEEINEQKRIDAIARMTTEFETERVEAENALLQGNQRLLTAEIARKNVIIIGGLAMLLILVVFGLVVLHGRRKLRLANATIAASLEEKNLLLKEIHHRVKNNLQVVSSLLDLQSQRIDDEKALSTFMEGQNRVKAMSLIHQKLYQSNNMSQINFEEYARLLTSELSKIYRNEQKVDVQVQAFGASEFDVDTAVPLGLILNELITNAYKYAFDSKMEGRIAVSLASLGEGKHQLIVEDNGTGLPELFDIQKAKSLGLRLVRRLAKQLYGQVEYDGREGARFTINFLETQVRKAT